MTQTTQKRIHPTVGGGVFSTVQPTVINKNITDIKAQSEFA
jgi:hypothetical protein